MGGVAGGAIGYSSGFSGGMLYSNGNWNYSHQSGVFGAQIGAGIGSFLGVVAGMVDVYSIPKPPTPGPEMASLGGRPGPTDGGGKRKTSGPRSFANELKYYYKYNSGTDYHLSNDRFNDIYKQANENNAI